MYNPAPVVENDTHKLLFDFDIKMDHLTSAKRPDLVIINKKKRIYKIVDFAVPADHREMKKLYNMKVTITSVVTGASGTLIKGLLKGLDDLEIGRGVRANETTTLLRMKEY